MIAEQRERLIETIFQAHYIKFGLKDEKKMLKIFGVSVPSLKDYCAKDGDWVRGIDRKPDNDFILDVLGTGKKMLPSADDLELDDALDDFFGFVIIDKEEIKQEAKADVEKKVARRKEKI